MLLALNALLGQKGLQISPTSQVLVWAPSAAIWRCCRSDLPCRISRHHEKACNRSWLGSLVSLLGLHFACLSLRFAFSCCCRAAVGMHGFSWGTRLRPCFPATLPDNCSCLFFPYPWARTCHSGWLVGWALPPAARVCFWHAGPGKLAQAQAQEAHWKFASGCSSFRCFPSKILHQPSATAEAVTPMLAGYTHGAIPWQGCPWWLPGTYEAWPVLCRSVSPHSCVWGVPWWAWRCLVLHAANLGNIQQRRRQVGSNARWQSEKVGHWLDPQAERLVPCSRRPVAVCGFGCLQLLVRRVHWFGSFATSPVQTWVLRGSVAQQY